jgi:RNA polymerase sigma factor (sigma-70 family)
MTDDLRIELKFKNKRLFDVVEQHGGAKAFAQFAGVSYGQVLELLSMRRSPKTLRCVENKQYGNKVVLLVWRSAAEKIATAAGFTAEEMFPEHLYPPLGIKRAALAAFTLNSTDILSLSEVNRPLMTAGPEQAILRGEVSQLIKEVLATLRPREEDVIRKRFGLDGPKMSCNEVSLVWKITPARVQQIEAKALRKLRHPKRAKLLLGLGRQLDESRGS